MYTVEIETRNQGIDCCCCLWCFVGIWHCIRDFIQDYSKPKHTNTDYSKIDDPKELLRCIDRDLTEAEHIYKIDPSGENLLKCISLKNKKQSLNKSHLEEMQELI